MSDPALELQRVLVATLKADPAVTALVGGRVYDAPPPNPTFPYITLGEDVVSPQRADCYDGSHTTLAVHGWSRAVGYPEVKRIGAAIRGALHEAPLAMADGQRLVDLALIDNRIMRDPDGLTSHTALTFRALTEPV